MWQVPVIAENTGWEGSLSAFVCLCVSARVREAEGGGFAYTGICHSGIRPVRTPNIHFIFSRLQIQAFLLLVTLASGQLLWDV